jgi:hypothetical protein
MLLGSFATTHDDVLIISHAYHEKPQSRVTAWFAFQRAGKARAAAEMAHVLRNASGLGRFTFIIVIVVIIVMVLIVVIALIGLKSKLHPCFAHFLFTSTARAKQYTALYVLPRMMARESLPDRARSSPSRNHASQRVESCSRARIQQSAGSPPSP